MGIKNGDTVSLDYEGKLEDGTIFDSSKHGDHSHPLTFKVGGNMVIPGFEKEVIGMKVGEEKTFKIKPKDGYGEPREELKRSLPRNSLPKEQAPEEGMIIVLKAPTGEEFPAKIVEVNKESIVIDLNHPLAGKTLTFNIKILEKK
jgi:FKBP-type peptidyl-prolyl cis-trans isomerase 2